jgi:hypothetical protein
MTRGAALVHDRSKIAEIERRLQVTLDKDQKRGMSDLAELYAGRFLNLLDSKPDRAF